MAIELKVEDYCDGCGEFEPDVDKTCYYSIEKVCTNTTIRCEHADLCRRLAEHLKSQKKEEEKA